MQFICKNIIGHKFHGHEIPIDKHGKPLQQIPHQFFCERCKSIRPVIEGWN